MKRQGPSWEHTGERRPDFAIEPGPGQESVWDYPRPPIAKSCAWLVEVRDGDTEIARSKQTYRLLETASPPTFYIPAADVNWDYLIETAGSSICEWKGSAQYWALKRDRDNAIGWTYPEPRPPFEKLKDHIAFYPGRIACFVAGEPVEAQAGHFYGGWVTDDIVGPFKGEPGTGHW